MITIHHLREDIEHEKRLSITFPMTNEIAILGKIVHNAEKDGRIQKLARELHSAVSMMTQVEAARAGMLEGLYEPVADIDLTNKDDAYVMMQNGVISPSWSRQPPEGLKPRPGTTKVIGGKVWGARSTSVGDIIDDNGVLFVVANSGFLCVGKTADLVVSKVEAGAA